jgi:DNA-binding winged helix-turn-helix (wHTH) protein/tetratricopeptide (TPR) repeat protein
MVSPENRGLVYRFGVFEVSAESRELFRHGHRIKLQDQPFELLLFLLEHPGEIVEREFLQQRLWPANTFVDFGQSLSTAVTKLRQALGDDADNPRFIETIPRRGYRFIAPVTIPSKTSQPEPKAEPVPASSDSSGKSQEGVNRTGEVERAREASRAPSKLAGHRWRVVFLPVIFASLLAGFLLIYLHQRRTAFVLAPKDTVVLADFENTTGESIFNDTLRQALIVGLAQSPIIHILSDRNSAVVFKQMGHSPDDRMTGRTAIELCKRIGGKVTVQGSISSLGTTYLIGLAAIRCDTGKPIAHEEVEASQRDDVIDALGKATSSLRARLGESLPSIQKYNAPLEQATTSSLDALNAYGMALSTWDAKGDQASIPYFKRAIELDPNFASAYGGLAAIYNNIGQVDLARESTIKAYNLRERVTESERASIEARYYLYVTEEIDKAASTYQVQALDYPDSAGTLNHLGTTNLRLGRNEQAADNFRGALLIDPTRASSYGNLALSLLRLNRVQEAQSALAAAEKRGFHTDYLLQVNYWVAFLNGNQKEMDRVITRTAEIPSAKPILQSEAATTEAYSGHFEKALSLSLSAVELMKTPADKDSAAACLAVAAVREGEVGSAANARSLIQQAGKLSNDKVTVELTALVSAQIGDYKKALSLSEALDKQFPHGTLVQGFWLPMIRGEVDLRQGRGPKAVEMLSVAQPFDPGGADGCSVSPLLPAYLLGDAYLAAGEGDRAGGEFRRLLDNRGMVLNSPFGALAYLGQARAYSLDGKPAEARKAYQIFFDIWKDADSSIPLLRQAQAEAGRLSAAR